jgi:uncharacterized protein
MAGSEREQGFDEILERIVFDMRERHQAVAVILYGSRAHGTHSVSSDWDVLVVSENLQPGQTVRDGRSFGGSYLDAFVEPAGIVDAPTEAHLRLLGGTLAFDPQGYGQRLLDALAGLLARGPKPLSNAERQQECDWLWRTLERCKAGDAASDYRRVQLLCEALPVYYRLRGRFFRGAKPSFLEMEHSDPAAFAVFQQALLPAATLEDLETLVALVAKVRATNTLVS